MIYLDASALVKLIFEETESEALAQWLTDRQDVPKVSSELSTIELLRTCRHRDQGSVAGARQVLTGLDLLPLSTDLIESAAALGPAGLRSLDAIHLASVLSLAGEPVAFVAYDARLQAAAAEAGLEVTAPQ